MKGKQKKLIGGIARIFVIAFIAIVIVYTFGKPENGKAASNDKNGEDLLMTEVQAEQLKEKFELIAEQSLAINTQITPKLPELSMLNNPILGGGIGAGTVDKTAEGTKREESDTETKNNDEESELRRDLEKYFTNKAIVSDEVDSYLNVRSAPLETEDDSIVGKLYTNAVVTVLSERDGWSRIRSGEVKGWVSSIYLLSGDEAVDVAEKIVTYKAVVKADSMNVRLEADKTSTIVDVAVKGDSYPVISIGDEWIRVYSGYQAYGYLAAEFVEVEYDFNTALSVEDAYLRAQLMEETTGAYDETSGEGLSYEEQAIQSKIAEENWKYSHESSVAESNWLQESSAQASRVAESVWLESSAQASREAEAAWLAESSRAAEAAWLESSAQASREAEANATQAPEVPAASNQVYLGRFRITHYCGCTKCCGKWGNNDPNAAVHGSSGNQLSGGYSIAVDTSIIPMGSQVVLNGKTYVAQDTGVGGNAIDIYCRTHAEALAGGMYYADVYIVR